MCDYFSSSFGSTAPGPFSQTTPTQSAFGSPTAFGQPQQQQKFGSPPTFGGPATFGAPATFGSGATFSNPKPSFGGFGSSPQQQQQQPNAFATPTQQNSLFEQLGSSENTMTFGNIAQTSSANQQKPQFGGSSFSSWR